MRRITLTGMLLLCAATFALSFTLLDPGDPPLRKFIVALDPGHGGKDPGCTDGEMLEKDIALTLAKKVKELAPQYDIEIMLTRQVDEEVSLEKRVYLAEAFQAELMVSLHVNEHKDVDRSGVEVYYNLDNDHAPGSRLFCRTFLENFEKISPQLEIVGIRAGGFHVLRYAPCPSVLLELGFISNQRDRTFLKNEYFHDKVAMSIVQSLVEYQRKR